MSRHETPMILEYWNQVGGTLIEEFQMVKRGPLCGPRRADAVIVLGGEQRRVPLGERNIDIAGKDVIVVQAKKNRLGMYLMGQAVFSAELMKALQPKSVRSVILCGKDDHVLRPLLSQFPNVEVVAMGASARLNRRTGST
jgi:hypothetical protein